MKNLQNDLFYKPEIKESYQLFIFGAHNTVYNVFNPVLDSRLTENDIALDLENRETVIEAIKKGEECFIVLEYEFK
ncbi:MAG: hypothetical protein LBE13_00220 [Bacteroidales bacterium]|jgi:hypothetical protein|nr:hypothetical protein [Bacteroidales bacterium]